MGIVDLDHEVGDGELELMDPQPPRLGARRKGMAGAEKQQNVRRLADHELPAFEERRRERRMLDARAVKQAHHCRAPRRSALGSRATST